MSKETLLDKLKTDYAINKRKWISGDKVWVEGINQECFIPPEKIFQDFIEMELLRRNDYDMEEKYYLMQIYKYGYQGIREIDNSRAFKKKIGGKDSDFPLSNSCVEFIKDLHKAKALYALDEIYNKEVVEYILKECGI